MQKMTSTSRLRAARAPGVPPEARRDKGGKQEDVLDAEFEEVKESDRKRLERPARIARLMRPTNRRYELPAVRFYARATRFRME